MSRLTPIVLATMLFGVPASSISPAVASLVPGRGRWRCAPSPGLWSVTIRPFAARPRRGHPGQGLFRMTLERGERGQDAEQPADTARQAAGTSTREIPSDACPNGHERRSGRVLIGSYLGCYLGCSARAPLLDMPRVLGGGRRPD